MTIKQQLDMQTIQARLRDYEVGDIVEKRNELVRRWREAHPAAANQRSIAFGTMIRMEEWRKHNSDQPDEIWFNDTYLVTLRRAKKDPVFGSDGGMVQLGISSHDGTARHDWRDFQAIKNQLAGKECEAFELYPAESRLLDPSNYYTLWCFPGVKRLKIGIIDREVRDADIALAPQRAFPAPDSTRKRDGVAGDVQPLRPRE